MTREELVDELWEAIDNRMDLDVSYTDLAEACVTRLEELGVIALARIEAFDPRQRRLVPFTRARAARHRPNPPHIRTQSEEGRMRDKPFWPEDLFEWICCVAVILIVVGLIHIFWTIP